MKRLGDIVRMSRMTRPKGISDKISNYNFKENI